MIGQKSLSSERENKSKFFYGYIIVLASYFIVLISWGTQYSFGVFFKPVLNEFGWTRAVTSGAYSVNMILTGVFCLVSGRLVGRLGPRIVLTVGGCFIGLGYLLMSKVTSEWQFYLFYGVIISIGMGCIVVPLLSTVARWFTKGRGLASGIVISGIGIGIVVMPQVANGIISKYDWRTSFLVLGIVAIILIIGFAQLLKRAPDQKSLPAKESHKSLDIQAQGISTAEAFHTRQFWIICLISILTAFTVQVVMVHMVAHATDIGFTAITAATIISVVGFVSIFGKISMGSLADRIGTRLVMVIVCILLALAFGWFRFAGDLWMLYAAAAIFAAGYSGASATHSPMVAEFFGLKSHGTLFGIAQLVANIGGAVGSFAAGYIFDTTGSYHWAFIIGALLCIISMVITLFLPVRKKDQIAVRAKSTY